MVLSTITYLDRVCISVAGPRMQKDLDLSPEKWGWVLGVFLLSYGALGVPSGALGDYLGQRKVLVWIVCGWSAFTAATGLVANYVLLLLVRFLFGAGEAGAYPNISGAISRWFPSTERARTQGYIWAASRLGGAFSPWLVVPMMVAWGWRAMFLFLGAMGLLWVLAWYGWYREPAVLRTTISEPESSGSLAGENSTNAESAPWGRLLRSRQLWLIMTMYWCYVWGSMFYISWLPTYLIRGRGLTETQMGALTALPFLMGMAGNLAGGFIGDRMSIRFGLSLGRRVVGSACLAVTALLLLATALTHGKAAAVVFLSIGFGVMDCMLPSAWAICLDVGRQYAGAVSGAMNTAGSAGGFFCSVLFGYLVKWSGNYTAPMFVIAAMVMASAVLFWQLDPTTPLLREEATAAIPGEATCT